MIGFILTFLRARAKLIGIIAIVAGLVGVYYAGYRHASLGCEAKVLKATAKLRARQDELIKELEDERQKRKVVYRDRVRVVERVADPTGCIDQPPPVDVVRAIRGQD